MSDKLNSNWRPPPSWRHLEFITVANFGHTVRETDNAFLLDVLGELVSSGYRQASCVTPTVKTVGSSISLKLKVLKDTETTQDGTQNNSIH